MNGCKWCYDRPGGCNACPPEPPTIEPLIVIDNAKDIKLLKAALGAAELRQRYAENTFSDAGILTLLELGDAAVAIEAAKQSRKKDEANDE